MKNEKPYKAEAVQECTQRFQTEQQTLEALKKYKVAFTTKFRYSIN